MNSDALDPDALDPGPLDPDRDRPLHTDAELQSFLDFLLQGATHRQFWLIMLADDGHVLEPLMPMDDHPDAPTALIGADDLGLVPFASVIAERARMVGEMVGASSFVFVWERTGSERFMRDELEWARAMARECETRGLRVRAQFLLHDGGTRQIAIDDYA